MAQNTIKAIILTTLPSNLVNAAYQPINPNGLDAACSIVTIQNDSTQDITVSLDGVNAHIFIKSNGTYWLPAQVGNHPNSYEALISKGTKFYVSGVAGVGLIYLSGFYV